jgi:UDP-glucose 4-epimerase
MMQRVTEAYHLAPVLHPPRKVNPVPRRLADTSRALADLGFKAEVSLEKGLRNLVRWRRDVLRNHEVCV